MCNGCWENFESPKILNEKVKKAVRLIEKVYKYNGAGGNLHVVLDDWNIEDCHVFTDFNDKYIEEHKESEGQYKAEKECIAQLRLMNEKERASALAIYDGYFLLTPEEKMA